jgi:hypothetical protein
VSVLAVTAVLTVLQFPFPQVRLALWRDPDLIAAGQWWLLGAVSARIWGVFWPLVGIALTVKQDHHGPPLLVGFAAGALLLWRDRRQALAPTDSR